MGSVKSVPNDAKEEYINERDKLRKQIYTLTISRNEFGEVLNEHMEMLNEMRNNVEDLKEEIYARAYIKNNQQRKLQSKIFIPHNTTFTQCSSLYTMFDNENTLNNLYFCLLYFQLTVNDSFICVHHCRPYSHYRL